MSTRLLLAIAALAALLFCIGFARQLGWAPMLMLKLIPVAAALCWIRLHGRGDRYQRWIEIGLLLSLLGDALLALPGDWFVPGLLAFLIAHLAYVVAYVGRSHAFAPVWLLFALVAAGTMLFLLFRNGHLGSMAGPVVVYTLVIAAMLWRAAAQRRFDATARFALIGAMLFVASDGVLAWNRFIDADSALRYVNILLYWFGQWGIAASTLPAHRAPTLARL